MAFDNYRTYYEVLNITPDATPNEIKEAYIRAKSAYNKDSVALYTLISHEERESALKHIEQAYQVLSDRQKRAEYDRCHGFITEKTFEINKTGSQGSPQNQKIPSIDRIPPMETSYNSDDFLIPPPTDISFTNNTDTVKEVPKNDVGRFTPPPFHSTRQAIPQHAAIPASSLPGQALSIEQQIAQEIEWKGIFLRRIRENRRISIEEMSSITKISKSYLNAIEEDCFAKLPAAVFLRGFVFQIARVLKLPADKVASAYIARYHKHSKK
ncbi:MAG: helix-turn-helix domain-containing protein [Bdellovibrionota bacterium]